MSIPLVLINNADAITHDIIIGRIKIHLFWHISFIKNTQGLHIQHDINNGIIKMIID